MMFLFIVGIWLFIVALVNLDIIHKSSPIGKELYEESKFPVPLPGSWQEKLFIVMLGASRR